MKEVLDDLLEEVIDLEGRAQELQGAVIEEETMWDDINGTTIMGYKLSEGVPTTAEFIKLCGVVGSILEILGAEKKTV